MRRGDRGGAVVASAVLAASLVGILAHRESLGYWFTASDTVPMIESSRVTDAGDFAALFTQPMMAGTRFVEFALFYRPVSSLSYAVDYRLWGLDPAGYHLTTVLLHGGAAAAATVALVVLTRRRLAGAFGGLLFAGHPLTVEVVPSAVRRQDVLLAVFLLAALLLFVRSRRVEDGRLALGGSLACYALALLAKEPALVFPGLVVAWVALAWHPPWRREALVAAARAVAPYLAVTVANVALRVAVLGGLGGYKRHPVPSPAEVVLILVEYPLSLGYPHDVVGIATLPGAGAPWPSVVAVMGVLASAVVVAAGLGAWRHEGAISAVAALATVAAVVAIPLAIAAESTVVRTVPVIYEPGELSIVRAYLRPSAAVVGLLLVGAVVAAAAWAWTDGRSALSATDRRALLFFAVWLVGPVVLFLPVGNYTFRSGYVSLVPAMGGIGLLLAAGIEGIRGAADRSADGPPWSRLEAPDVVMVGVALLLVVPLAATSPLVHDYDGWAASGRVNEATLGGVRAATEGAPSEADVEIEGMVGIVADRGCSFPQAKTLQFARPGTVEAWLRLHDEERRVTAHDDRILSGNPERVWVTSGRSGGNVTATVHYETVDPGPCVRTPWERY
jgi:hypothetical protein